MTTPSTYNGQENTTEATLFVAFELSEKNDTFHFPFPLCSHLQESCFLAKDWNFSDVVRV